MVECVPSQWFSFLTERT